MLQQNTKKLHTHDAFFMAASAVWGLAVLKVGNFSIFFFCHLIKANVIFFSILDTKYDFFPKYPWDLYFRIHDMKKAAEEHLDSLEKAKKKEKKWENSWNDESVGPECVSIDMEKKENSDSSEQQVSLSIKPTLEFKLMSYQNKLKKVKKLEVGNIFLFFLNLQ